MVMLKIKSFNARIMACHSTDFEVHRNWLAITYCTNISEWYSEATSKWTLDYPPFFAYFEWALAQIGSKLDPKMVVLSTETYSSLTTIYFQRITVLLSECLLLYSIYIHFQYNGFLFGILFLSILKAFQGNFLWSGFWFSVLLNFKHIFVYVAPVYFVFMLFHYCLKRESGRVKVVLGRLFLMAAVVGIVFTVSLAPFIYWGKLAELLARLFPFQRGLCHSYWAPNFWALYNAADKMFSASGMFYYLG
ncbi:putative dolichyl pyrophosphate Glc1Man9GlcNAc2 alpha-1,3-glucosyltransferase [Echinococcus granulosus]|uniref:Alpha-1,3-glucosyltransferase n=1 Tax=Echinococcus granulosus TaxID=6210 RepID=W6UF03_ECHGR|nr:putative dolichyl pyrophosphate Glc1Man9GlcNAc2 alpha-1,3-glucosyltransferase [Echinococcus granulosus]EUB56727.1 putative dolichyl pyrophosphate Glc1Man9GlcNAc2 alpha-1,3-glucosyltransferase [Echinococcus granulosus]